MLDDRVATVEITNAETAAYIISLEARITELEAQLISSGEAAEAEEAQPETIATRVATLEQELGHSSDDEPSLVAILAFIVAIAALLFAVAAFLAVSNLKAKDSNQDTRHREMSMDSVNSAASEVKGGITNLDKELDILDRGVVGNATV